MARNNNQVLLEQMVKAELDEFNQDCSINEFFEFYSAIQILKDYELSYDELSSGISGDSLDGGADSIYILVNGELVTSADDIASLKKNPDIELILIQSKYENSFKEDPLLKLSRLTRNLLDLEFDRNDFEGRYNDQVLSTFELFRDVYMKAISKRPNLNVRVYYVSKGVDIHPNVREQAEDLKTDICSKLTNAHVDVDFVGANDLLKLTQEKVNNHFKLVASESPLSTSGQVFIVLSNLVDYYNFITDDQGKLIKHIFESNVRDYQGKTNVNKEINDTLEEQGKEEFWWLNNGVTILASEITAPGGKELIIHDPEIVNGLQTSSEIHRFFSTNPDRRENEERDLLIRVIVPESEETRDKIIRATNSQTPIPKSSLRATDLIHRQIEEYLKPRGLYYDRRKNFYKNEGKKPKEIISVPFMSQCLMSTLMQKPDAARARPSTLLEDDRSYNILFHTNNSLDCYYNVAKWGRKIEEFLRTSRDFETSTIADIKFYVLYFATALIVNDAKPTQSAISNADVSELTDDMLNDIVPRVYRIYESLGGTNKVAKGKDFIEGLKAIVELQLANYLDY
ncbi:AIPR family protein [Vibrio rotiferianus]|uniref:AIPR family protein n=1 Tax=Vibrio rotiferianus TaxID=190895 RepID=UPI00390973A9